MAAQCYPSMNAVLIYPGTFDPPTCGHIDLVRRAVPLFGGMILAVSVRSTKPLLFDIDERVEMLHAATRSISGVMVKPFDGLLVDFARAMGAHALLRGIRAVSDMEYEFQMAMMNRMLSPDLQTVFMMPGEDYAYVSSSLIKDVACHGGDISTLVPPEVCERLKRKFSKQVIP